MADTVRELTFGEKAVGLTFNPSGDPKVQSAKEQFASLIDYANDIRNTSSSEAASRHASIAITMLEDAQMRVVKALTWQD